MTDRDYFAAAALTRGMGVLGYEQIAKSCYEMADAMIRERGRTNHDAVPEAIARTDPSESSVPLGNGGGCGGTDKPVTLPAMGTGNLSEAEIDAIECVVEDGRIASMSVYGVMRSLLVRLRPEWESPSYDEGDEKRTNTNTDRDDTPSEGSVHGEGTVGMAGIAYQAAENLQGVCKTFDQWSRQTAGVMYRLARHIELLESRVLSDAEREAIALAYSRLTADAKYEEVAATLKAFLARMRK